MTYTLRLSTEQDEQLKRIMYALETPTASKAICHLIARFEDDQKELRKLRKQTERLTNERNQIRQLVKQREQLDVESTQRLKDW